jgi:hypothetical protein
MVDRDGGKTYEGTDRKMFKGANKLNKVIEKRGRAADVQALRPTGETAKSLSNFTSPAKYKIDTDAYKKGDQVVKANLNKARNIGKKKP